QIVGSSLSLLGELEVAKAGITVMGNKWNKAKQRGIIKVSNKHLKGLSASLALIDRINSKKVITKSLGVSGTLKKAEKYIAM
ncbi:Rpp14/Pop5 family protein, partial [Thermoproteota archaeon]